MEDVHAHIEELVAEEHRLWQLEADGSATGADRERLDKVKVGSTATGTCSADGAQPRPPARTKRASGCGASRPSRTTSSRPMPICTHLDQVELTELPASIPGCEECLKTGSRWLHRVCARPAARSAAATRRR